MIVGVAEVLRPVVSRVVVIAAEDDQYADLGLDTRGDLEPHRGPLGGIATALADFASQVEVADQAEFEAESGWLLLVACDWANPSVRAVRPLMEAVSQQPAARAAAYFTDRWQPLPMLLHREALPDVQAQLHRGEGALWRLLNRLDAVKVSDPEARDVPVACEHARAAAGRGGGGEMSTLLTLPQWSPGSSTGGSRAADAGLDSHGVSDAPRLGDRHGRGIGYLRLSLTRGCSMRCLYCRPAHRPQPARRGAPHPPRDPADRRAPRLAPRPAQSPAHRRRPDRPPGPDPGSSKLWPASTGSPIWR